MRRAFVGVLLAGSISVLVGCSSGDGTGSATGGSGGMAANGGSGNASSGGSGNASSGGSGNASSGGTGNVSSGGTGNASSGGSSSGGTGASSSGGGGNPGDPEPPEMNGMTAAHNAARANVNPPAATPIPPLGWATDVAAVAQAYAENCVFQHSMGSYGENLYATTSQATPQEVVDSWMSEAPDYDYASNSCSAICGHYTQVVWAKSTRLGCGMANCTQNSPFGGGAWQLWVCNYDPPGNFNGEKPY